MKTLRFGAVATALFGASLLPAAAADLPARGPASVPAAYMPVATWTGFYIGGNAGYGWGDQTLSFSGAGSSGSIEASASGFVGGGQIGYNWQTGNWVFGVEADIQGTTAKDTLTGGVTIAGVATTVAVENKIDYLGTVRGRLGYAGGTWMAYFTGGWAYAGGTSTATLTVAGLGTFTASSSSSRTDGWTVGGGVEWMMSPNWIAGVEYLFVRFGGESATAAGVTVSTSDMDINIVRGRLSYKF
ncbi:MAG: outer membrane beta-barrel protein [Xanthobacteraceae bacterium]|nr:outer membrane beta-barrel protein [Xanthobacteraceae bacterium]